MVTFASWYRERHAREPFPWQKALAERIERGDWPDALTVPTGAGKTAIVDIWLWAYLTGVSVPRRLVYVIDRRLIVDSVSTYAQTLVESLARDQRPSVITMRGGITIDDDWLDPARAAIIVTTVDQAGSRLLFHGYGVSPRAAPIHAALLGNDTLWVLDEVHLVVPFVRTLKDVEQLRGNALPLPMRVLPMSATYSSAQPHGLTAADHADPVLARRLNARKPTKLRKIRVEEDLAGALVEEAVALRGEGAHVVAVVCNRVATARSAYEDLRIRGETILLTGRVRPVDRDRIAESWLPSIATGSRARGREPLFVVATQTIEVGADLDFDGLVSECAPVSSLRQRVGRLNRLGELEAAPLTIVHQPRSTDLVYGTGANDAWNWLSAAQKAHRREPIDFGINAFDRLAERATPPAEPEPDSPCLLAGHLDILAQTSIDSGLRLEPWLHGWRPASIDVYASWRVDPSPESVAAAPPTADEILAIPVYALRTWTADVADVEGVSTAEGHSRELSCFVWDGETVIESSISSVRPGATVVLDARSGGCDEWGWAPGSSRPVDDVGNNTRRIRLHGDLLPELAERIAALLEQETPPPASAWRTLARDAGFSDPGRVVAYPGGALVLARSEWTSAAAVRPVSLGDHLRAVAARAQVLAESCQLPEDLVRAARAAGSAHDRGKTDLRWQAAVGGDRSNPLAKGPRADAGWLALPRGWRHEMASATALDEPLVRHLVGTHHGYGRPLFPAAADLDLWRSLDGWAGQFATLQAELGWWGLAFLEAVVRLADWQVSAEEQQ